MTIRPPCENDVLMPPAALVRMSVLTPSAATTRVPNTTVAIG